MLLFASSFDLWFSVTVMPSCLPHQSRLILTQACKQTSGDPSGQTWNYCGITLVYNFTAALLYMVSLVTMARIVTMMLSIYWTVKINCMPFKQKVNKSNFTCIKCADKERFKTWLKQSLAYRFYNTITLFTCCHCCEWHQWCKSHVIHCRCNICCKLTTQLLHK